MVIAQDNANKRKGIAFTATVLFHGLLCLMFILWKLITPIPPFPEAGGGGGMTVDLGYSDVGQGDNNESMEPERTNVAPAPVDDSEDNLLTEEDPGSPVAVPKPEDPKVQPKPKPDRPKPVKPKPTAEELEQAAKDKMNALFNTKGKPGEGNDGKPGNAGRPDGTPGGDGNGTGGTGGGTGTGNGSGAGPGADGMGFNLTGRSVRYKPVINEKPSVAGKVVLDIVVDADGNVLRTNQNLKLSTSLRPEHLRIATEAAMKWKFDKRTAGAPEQRGTITFIFRVS
ncbi:MAG TPA: hypothetical protein PLB89_10090 [Flavobacteriales bacterium]|nr:hypothetical protein [Flavobacteriales bacterium]